MTHPSQSDSPTTEALARAELEAEVGQRLPGPEGALTLKELGVDHFYDSDEWEATYGADQMDLLEELMIERDGWNNVDSYRIETLIAGPTLYAVRIPTAQDDAGDDSEWDVRLFATAEDARAAIAKGRAHD